VEAAQRGLLKAGIIDPVAEAWEGQAYTNGRFFLSTSKITENSSPALNRQF